MYGIELNPSLLIKAPPGLLHGRRNEIRGGLGEGRIFALCFCLRVREKYLGSYALGIQVLVHNFWCET